MAQTIFEQIGGFSTVSRVVMDFYECILDSDKVGDYFEDIEIPALVDHQTKFIASLLGGPASYTDEHIHVAHARLNIDAESFEEMKAILGDTLRDHGLGPEDVTKVVDSIEQRRHLIVTR